MILTLSYRKYRAGSLIATLILSLIIFFICGMLILALYHFKYFMIRDQVNQRLEDDLHSGIEQILTAPPFKTIYQQDSGLLFEGATDSLYYRLELWGCFLYSGIKATYKGRAKTTSFLYGSADFHYRDASLYLTDHDRPLSLSGETYIEGKAYLPKSGLRSGFFQQKGFLRKNLIEGTIDNSSKQLPALQDALRKHLYELGNRVTGTLNMASRDTADSITQSFLTVCRQIVLPRDGILQNRYLRGKLIVVSDSVIVAGSNADLEDVILVAPFIHFTNGFKGAVQAIALDSITAESGCIFRYPTALVGLGRSNTIGNTGATVTLREGSTLHGMILALSENDHSHIKPIVKIKPGSTVKGLIYNEGQTYLNGHIEGAIFTNFFLEQRGPMSMENILIDATITPSRWFKDAGYFSIFKNAKHHTLLKWLY